MKAFGASEKMFEVRFNNRRFADDIYEKLGFTPDQKKIVNKALDGDFLGARELLREVMVVQGTSGEDMVTQIYQEVSRMALEDSIREDIYIK